MANKEEVLWDNILPDPDKNKKPIMCDHAIIHVWDDALSQRAEWGDHVRWVVGLIRQNSDNSYSSIFLKWRA